MRFGLFGGARTDISAEASDSQLYTDYIDYVCEAEQLGFHSVFLVEHHFTGFNQISASLSFLTYLAAKTTTMRLGTAVVVLPWHNPALLVEQAATLDVLSGGRFDFGVGRGYRANEFAGFCMPMNEADERYQETLEFIRKAWTTKGRFSHHGKFWNYEDVVIEPAPLQQPHPPLWIGAASEGSIKKIAGQGLNLLLPQNGSPEEMGRSLATYRQTTEAAGRVFNPYSVGLTRALHVAMNDREREQAHDLRLKFVKGVRELAKAGGAQPLGFVRDYASTDAMRAATEQDALIGPPDELIARIKTYQDAGIEYLLLMDVGGSRSALRTFAREVMPAFADSKPAQRVRAAG